MAAVASQILQLAGVDRAWRDVLRGGTAPHPGAERDAVAMFLAAMCTLHWERRLDRESPLPHYWCEKALQTWGGIHSVMEDYAAMHAAPVEAWGISVEEQRFFGSARCLDDHTHLLQGEGRRLQRMSLDGPGLRMIGRVLEAADPEAPVRISNLLLKHHSIGSRPVELTQPYYHWSHQDAFASCLDDPSCSGIPVYQASWHTSRFCFVSGGPENAVIEITARLPESAGLAQARVSVLVNGHQTGMFAAGRKWRRHTIAVPRRALIAGINQLSVLWPAVSRNGTRAQERILGRLEKELPANLHPVFGELASVRVRGY
jgi:hypothetical protein